MKFVKWATQIVLLLVVCGLGYLFLLPSPVEPVAWDSSKNQGFTGPYTINDRLAALELVPLEGKKGPEGLALAADGSIWTITSDSTLIRVDPVTGVPKEIANLGGHPLELEFAPDGVLYFTDAFHGLRSWTAEGGVKEELTEVDGIKFSFGEDVDITADGTVYFSIATTRHNPVDYGSVYDASINDIIEHQKTGAVFWYEPATGESGIVAQGFAFANGLALSEDDSYLLLSELGSSRVWRIALEGEKKHVPEILLEGLPSVPDNLSNHQGDVFILGLISPRNPTLDSLADKPFLRKALPKLPASLRPAPTLHSFLLMVDGRTGKILENLQDPDGGYPLTTGAVISKGNLWVSSFSAPGLGRMTWPD